MTPIGAPGFFTRAIGRAVISGGVAGDHSVPGGIGSGDSLIAVHHVSADLVTNTDITAEFTIDAANLINNTGGTNTSGNFLAILWAEAVA